MAEKSASTAAIQGRKARRGGPGPSAEKSRKLADAIEQLRVDHGEDAVQMAVRQGDDVVKEAGTRAGQDQFPVRMYAPDEYDQVYQLKTTAPRELGQKTLTTDDLEYLKRKSQMQSAANFKAFIGQLYDAKDPAQAAILERMYPQLNAERESIIDERAELEKRLAKMRLRGPRNEEDLRMLYALASGQVTAPQGALWNPSTWYPNSPSGQRLARGFFNPLRTTQSTADPGQMPFDFVGSSVTRGGPNPLASAPFVPTGDVSGTGVLGGVDIARASV